MFDDHDRKLPERPDLDCLPQQFHYPDRHGRSGLYSTRQAGLAMSTFYVSEGQFWLDDQPQQIQAGEFHYFRTPPEHWAHRLGLLQQAGFNTLATYIPWLWH